jgi:hypothetical protein
MIAHSASRAHLGRIAEDMGVTDASLVPDLGNSLLTPFRLQVGRSAPVLGRCNVRRQGPHSESFGGFRRYGPCSGW